MYESKELRPEEVVKMEFDEIERVEAESLLDMVLRVYVMADGAEYEFTDASYFEVVGSRFKVVGVEA